MIVTYAASTTKKVTITRGSWYYYADYGLGSYQTAPYKVKYGNVSATAYCVQPSKRGPDDGTYKITKLSDGKSLAKVCYYGTKASGDDGFFAEKHPDFSAGKRFIITHMAAAYANGSSDAFSGTNSTGKSLAMELYNFCMSQPEIPEVDMAFSNPNVTAYVDGNQQRTEEVTFLANTLQSITFKLPAGVKFHNVTTGKTSAAGASVEINGGTKFYLSAPITQAADVSATFSATMKGTIVKDYSAYKISTGGDLQDLAFVFGEAVDDEKYVDFSVTWVSQASVSIVKKDKKTNAAVAGAVYGLYSDPDCTNLIMEMPAIRLEGDAVQSLTVTFLEMWNAVSDKDANDSDFSKYLFHYDYAAQPTGFVQPYADSPMDNEQVGEEVYISMINKAEKYCWFMTPYLIITDEMTHALCLAAKRGVDVRIITPGIPDKKFIYNVTRSFYHGLVKHGVRVYEWTPGFCHAKMSMADDCMATCGTINLDYRSLYHHFENGCFMADCQAVVEIKNDLIRTMGECRDVTDQYQTGRSAYLRLGQLFMRLFAGLL